MRPGNWSSGNDLELEMTTGLSKSGPTEANRSLLNRQEEGETVTSFQ